MAETEGVWLYHDTWSFSGPDHASVPALRLWADSMHAALRRAGVDADVQAGVLPEGYVLAVRTGNPAELDAVVDDYHHEIWSEAQRRYPAQVDNPPAWVTDEAAWRWAKDQADKRAAKGKLRDYWAYVTELYKVRTGARKNPVALGEAEDLGPIYSVTYIADRTGDGLAHNVHVFGSDDVGPYDPEGRPVLQWTGESLRIDGGDYTVTDAGIEG